MRLRFSYSNANAAQVAANVLRDLGDLVSRAGIHLSINTKDPAGGNDVNVDFYRNEDSISQLLAVEHVHDDGSVDHNKGDSVVGDSSVLPVSVRHLDPGRVYPAEELRRDPETFSVTDMIGDSGSAGDAARQEAYDSKVDPEAAAEGATVPSDELAAERLDDDGAPTGSQPNSGS